MGIGAPLPKTAALPPHTDCCASSAPFGGTFASNSGVELPTPCRGPSSTGKFVGLKPQQFQTFSGVELRRRTFPAQVRRVSSTVLKLQQFQVFLGVELGRRTWTPIGEAKFDGFT